MIRRLSYCHIVILFFTLFLTACGDGDVEVADVEFVDVGIEDAVIKAEVARDLGDQMKGLSERDFLREDEGMLFVYDTFEIRSFWMKGMKFPLDIIFIKDECRTNDANAVPAGKQECQSTNVRIVDFVENLPAPFKDEEPARYQSSRAANYVLEVKAGIVQKYGIEIGDRVDLKW